MKFEHRLFIDGSFVDATGGKTIETVNPVNGEVIQSVQEASEADVNKAVDAATEAFRTWKDSSGTKRRDILNKIASLLEERQQEYAELESLDNGKPVAVARDVDIFLAIECYRYYAGWADKMMGKTIPLNSSSMFCFTRHEPVGVVGQIIPWNFPLLMQAWKLAPALCCGCTVVMKLSEKTPLSGLAFATILQDAGLPNGVVNILNGFGPSTGSFISHHKKIQKVAFTGSSAVGHLIQKAAAESNLKRVTLELGGKSPLIIFKDADLDQALNAAHVGLFLNHGQCCIASSRVFVEEEIYDSFVAKATEQAKNRRLLDPTDENCDQGPQVDKVQFDKIMNYIALGQKQGARLTTGGKQKGDKGFWVEPTVFADVTDDMTIAKEEIFGPVMSIIKFKGVEEAIERANNTIYGLGAGVCTRDVGKALHVANNLNAGTVYVNTYNHFDAAAPFGGFKSSGHGRELGPYGLDAYTEVKTVIIPTQDYSS